MHLTSNRCVAIRFKMLTYCVYAALLNLIDALPLNPIYNFETASSNIGLVMKLNSKRLFPIVILTAIFCAAVFLSDSRAESDTFPVPSVIEPNVAFWTQIYTEYSSDHGVLHDSRKLNIVYGVIELVDPDRYGGRKNQ